MLSTRYVGPASDVYAPALLRGNSVHGDSSILLVCRPEAEARLSWWLRLMTA